VRRFDTQQCSNGELMVSWLDLAPGRMLRDTSVWFEIRRASDRALVVWDDHNDVDVRLGEREKNSGAWWSLRWVAAQPGEAYTITFRPASATPDTINVTCQP
jgi:hypothetical protein